MLGEIGFIRLKDLEIFNEVARAKSIREVARRMNSTSGQISKAIQALERRMASKLFRRSASGVLLTSQGSELKIIVDEILQGGEKIDALISGKNKLKVSKILAVAGTSFLNTHFITPIVCRASSEWGETVFRFLDLAPDQLVPIGLRGGFDMAVHIGPVAWPGTWTTQSLGKCDWLVCIRDGHPLSKRAALKQILEYPFVVPTYWTQEGLVRGNDQFPTPLSKRKVGYETATADAAIPILLNTNQVAFLPELLARPFLKSKQLRELQVTDNLKVRRAVFLSAKSDVVPARIFATLVKEMSESLNSKS